MSHAGVLSWFFFVYFLHLPEEESAANAPEETPSGRYQSVDKRKGRIAQTSEFQIQLLLEVAWNVVVFRTMHQVDLVFVGVKIFPVKVRQFAGTDDLFYLALFVHDFYWIDHFTSPSVFGD